MRDVWRDVWRDVRKREALADVINLALGAWLFLTPWIFGFTSEAATSWNAWLSGLAIGAIAIAALVAFTDSKPIAERVIQGKLASVVQIMVHAVGNGATWRTIPAQARYTVEVEEGQII